MSRVSSVGSCVGKSRSSNLRPVHHEGDCFWYASSRNEIRLRFDFVYVNLHVLHIKKIAVRFMTYPRHHFTAGFLLVYCATDVNKDYAR